MSGYSSIKVNFEFNANTKAAEQQMKNLQNQLSNLANGANISQLSLTPQLKEAQRSALDLKIALQNATNVNTGKLNLNKFQSELQRSGKTLEQYAAQFKALGPAGTQAFNQIASTIANADTKILSLSGGMKKLVTTFANTARWQLTNTIIQGITSSISDTVKYAKELDSSLNDIRIVSGQSADQMARFAKEANIAAKRLSTTTNEYAKASLIYYQQGLSTNEVKERTDITIKLSNVVGESAQTVSDWMTAIWNNFDDGSKSLEYYADVLAKLGAVTASSADEIAGGLEKFAAVADTIGLSYEYAASMLATITAETRQSEEVVGTALKTILSRMESLSLGETLEDGTNLGRYSQALAQVGVDIKTTTGELKEMDTILDETGARWQLLSQDQKVALAQSVAGVRQYTQFMALMDNWDIMEQNIEISKAAADSLNTQNLIFAQSVEAAENRVAASSERLKSVLLNSDDLVPLYDFGAGALEMIAELTEAFGGLPGLISMVVAALMNLYQPQIASFISQLGVSLTTTGSALGNFFKGKGFVSSKPQEFKINAQELASSMAAESGEAGGVQASNLNRKDSAARTALIQADSSLTETAKQRATWELEKLSTLKEQTLELSKQAELMSNAAVEKFDKIESGVSAAAKTSILKKSEQAGVLQGQLGMAQNAAMQGAAMTTPMTDESRADFVKKLQIHLKDAAKAANELDFEIDETTFEPLEQSLNQFLKTGDGLKNILESITNIKQELNAQAQEKIDVEIDQAAKEGASISTAGGMSEIMSGIKDDTDIDTTAKSLNKIKADDFSSSKDKSYIKNRQARLKVIQQEKKDLEKLTKGTQEYQKAETKLNKDIKSFNKGLKQKITNLSKDKKALKDGVKSIEDYNDEVKNTKGTLKDASNASKNAAAQTEVSKDAVDALGHEYDEFNTKLNGNQFTHWSDNLAKGLGTVATLTMGINMLSSAFTQMGKSVASGNMSWQDWIANLSSVFMSLMMVIPAIGQMAEMIQTSTIFQKKETEEKKKNIVVTTLQTVADKLQAAHDKKHANETVINEGKKRVAKIPTILTNIAEQISQGPKGWITAAISAAAIAALIGVAIAGISSGAQQGQEEKNNATIEKSNENLELIDENKGLSTSVKDLTDEYNRLKESGESAYDTFADLTKQIPELIDNYRELAKTLGLDINISALEDAVEYFKLTGDSSKFEEEQAKADAQVKQAQKDQAETGLNAAKSKMLRAATAGSNDGTISDNKYEVTIGGGSWNNKNIKYNGQVYTDEEKAASAVLEKNLGDMWDGNKISFGTSASEVITGYEAMAAAKAEMEKEFSQEELDSMDTYRELNRELEEMAEGYEEAKKFANEFYEIAREDIQAQDDSIAESLGIVDYDSFVANRDKAIDKILEQNEGLSRDQAEQLLKESELFKQYEKQMELFADDGKIAEQLKLNGANITKEQVQTWFNTLNEEQKSYVTHLDWSIISNFAEAEEQIAEIQKKAEEAKINAEVEELGYDTNTFEAYTDLLVDTNEHLEENNILSKQIALNNLRLNKGLATLADSWKEIDEVLDGGKRGTIEYAEALGKIRGALEEAFDYAPSTKFIENNMETIEKLAEGDVSALQKLQDELAKDYVANMEIKASINEGEGFSVEEVQNELYGLLNSLDTSLEIGEGTTISDDYLNTLQTMLDNGQITAEQLQGLMRAKGFELEITGWKKVPGPTRTITRTGVSNGQPVDETITEQEEMEVPIINGQGDAIKGTANKASIKKSSGASAINKSTLDKNKESSGSSKEKKNASDEIERYHEIDKTLERLNREYERLSDAKDRAFGKARLQYLDQEIAKTKELAEATREKLTEAEANLATDRAAIEKYGVSLNEYGEITNYDEVFAAQIAQYNKNPEAYEDAYSNFTDAIAQYEETLSTVEDLKDEARNYMNQEMDLKLEGVQYKVDLQVDLADNDLKLIEFQMESLTDSIDDLTKKFSALGRSADANLKKLAAAETGIKDTLELSGFTAKEIEQIIANPELISTMIEGKKLTEAQVEALNGYVDQIIEGTNELRTMRDEISDNLVTAFEDMNKEMDSSIEKLEHFSSLISSFQNIIDLAGEEALGVSAELMQDMLEAQASIAQNQIEISKAQLQQNMAARDSLQEQLDAATSDAAKKEIQEAIDEIDETIQDNQSSLLSALESGLQAAADLFAREMDDIISEFEDAFAGAYGTFEQMQAAYDRRKEMNERYLDDYKKIYSLSKLNRDLENSIDTTDSIRAKERLRDLQEEINALQESNTEMTQYEVDELRARYDLRLAEIALEEAQNAKSQVRMRRDASGNWGYVYTADEAAVGSAEQNYEDKLYAYQQKVQEYTDEMMDRMVQIPQEYAEAVRAIYEDQTLTDEERRLAIEELQDYYQGMYDYVVQQLGLSNEHAKVLYAEDWKNYSTLTGYKISANDDWRDSFDETVLSQVTGFSTLEAAQDNFKIESDKMLNAAAGSYATYRTNVKTTLDLALGDIEKFLGLDGSEGGLKHYLDQYTKEAKEAANEAKRIGEENEKAFEKAAKAAGTWLSEYGGKVDQWATKTNAIATAVNGIETAYSNLDKQIQKTKGEYDKLEQQAKEALSAMQTADQYAANRQVVDNEQLPESDNLLSFTGYAAAKKIVGDEGYTVASGAKLLNMQYQKDSIKRSTGFEEQIANGLGKIEYIDKNGKKQTAYIDQATAKSLGLYLYTSSPTLTQRSRTFGDIKSGDTVQIKGANKKYYSWDAKNNKFIDSGLRTQQSETLTEVMVTDKKQVGGVWYLKIGDRYWLDNAAIKLDTGGYTGSWDSSGRLAMLHQKELVLNASDTANFLAAVDILRDITKAIDLQALSQANMLGAITSASVGTTAQVIEQEVTIHAEFPNATERSEIEAAFDTLLNRASQFANRKNK